MPTLEDAIKFYEENYDVLGSWLLRPGEKVMLGDKENRVCRFCGRTKPEVQFRKAFVWDNMAKTSETDEFDAISDPKTRFDLLARKEIGTASYESVSSQDILATQLRRLNKVPADHPEIVKLHDRLAKAAGS